MTTNTLEVPMILPLRDGSGTALKSAYKLRIVNGFNIYYSYQHPIAFYSRKRLVRRAAYWSRRRRDRATHVICISTDVTTECGGSLANVLIIDAYDGNLAGKVPQFVELLKEEFAYCGTMVIPAKNNEMTIVEGGKGRRVKI